MQKKRDCRKAVPSDGECGIRTHVPGMDNCISSAARYDPFDNSPCV